VPGELADKRLVAKLVMEKVPYAVEIPEGVDLPR
jgi:hypothetical protein